MKKNRKRDVLFLCQYFYPENNSSATLPFDTASGLASVGYSVSALCGMPKEYTKERNVSVRETVDGVQIHRLRYLQIDRGKRIGRIVNFFSFTLRALLSLREIAGHRMVVVYSNPPVLPWVAVMANKLFGTKFVFVSYDIYPEIAIRMDSIRKNGVIDRVMAGINQAVFRRASAVVALSNEMRETLLSLRPQLDTDRAYVLPNWAHESKPRSLEPKGDCLTVGYFGNLGVVQDAEILVSAMEQLKDNKRIRFFIVGHGSRFEFVRKHTEALPNVRIERFLTGEELERALGICDCCIISLRAGLHELCMPSKYYSYLQAGTAVVSIMEKDSELSREVVSEHIGEAVAPGDKEGLCDALMNMADNLLEVRKAGERAAALYQERYQRKKTLEQFTALVQSVLENG